MIDLPLSWTWAGFAALLFAMAAQDARHFRIPNALVIALLLLFVGVAALAQPGAAIVSHLEAGGTVLAIGFLLFLAGVFGAGDAKLMAVVGLWSGFAALPMVLLAVTLSGLALLVLILPLRLAFRRLRQEQLPQIFRPRSGVPYGLAIGIGTVLVSGQFPSWLWPY